MKTKFFLFGIIFLLCENFSFAQEDIGCGPAPPPTRIYTGPTFSFQKNFFSAGIFNPHDQPEFGHFHEAYQSSSAGGFFIGWNVEYLLGDVKNSTSSIIGKIFFQRNYSAQFSGAMEGAYLHDNSSVKTPTEFFADVEYSGISFQVFYKQIIINRLFITAGPGMSYVISGQVSKRQTIIGNPDSTFTMNDNELKRGWRLSEDRRTIFYPSKELNKILFAANISLGYELPVRRLIFVPNLNFSMGINPLGAFDKNLRVYSLQPGLDISYIF